MSIRAATDADLPRLVALHAISFTPAWDVKALKALMASGAEALLAADGFILIRVAADEAEILTICVAPQSRRQGQGRALLAAACARACEEGAKRMFLEVARENLAARKLYEGFGFSEVGQRKSYYPGAGDALVLAAALPLVSHGKSA